MVVRPMTLGGSSFAVQCEVVGIADSLGENSQGQQGSWNECDLGQDNLARNLACLVIECWESRQVNMECDYYVQSSN
jgi:hypothetical protein